jgi:hypothetical protein
MTKGDILLLLAVFFAAITSALALWVYHQAPSATNAIHYAVVTVNNQQVARLTLTPGKTPESHIIQGPNGSATLLTEAGRVRMLSSQCRDKICIKQGWISKPGESIICLPERIVVTIEGAGAIDAITR